MKKSNFIVNIDLLLAAIALTVLVCVTFGGVIMRYFVGKPIIWAEEVQLWCFLWMTFLGAGAAFRHGSHVAVEIVVSLFPQKIQKFIEKMDYVICMVVLGYLGYLGCDIIKLMMKIGKSTSILHVPFYFINGIIPVCCVLMMVSLTYATFFMKKEDSKDEKHISDDSEEEK